MAYNVTKLISNAYYLAGILAPDAEEVSGSQLTRAMDLLNDILGNTLANPKLVPYFKIYNLNQVVGQEGYFIENLNFVETVTFELNTVRYSMESLGRREFFGTPRANGIESLTFSYHFEREKGGGKIYVYFLPQAAYPMQIVGKFGLDEIDDPQLDLSLYYDRYYITYLYYSLASYICDFYSKSFVHEKRLIELSQQMKNLSPPDLMMSKFSSLNQGPGLSWDQINLGRGLVPS